MNNRIEKAKDININKEDVFIDYNPDLLVIASVSGSEDVNYQVSLVDNVWFCQCDDFHYRGEFSEYFKDNLEGKQQEKQYKCKHIQIIIDHLKNKGPIKTKFGNVRLNGRYYMVTSGKEGNHGKLLHRLIYEYFHGKIPEGYIVHHKNGDRFDNTLSNLELMKYEDHASYHHIGKIHSEESKRKMSETKRGLYSEEKNPFYRHDIPNRKKLFEEQKNTGLNYRQLAEKYGCHAETIRRRINSYKKECS